MGSRRQHKVWLWFSSTQENPAIELLLLLCRQGRRQVPGVGQFLLEGLPKRRNGL